MSETANYAPINGAEFYYDVQGTGQPLVLVHSLLFDSSQWDEMIPALAQHFKVVRYDQRGCGRTRAADLKVDDGDDLLALLDYLKLDKIYLLGLSVGGEIALYFTLQHPERVAALIMAGGGPVGWVDSEPGSSQEAQFHAAARSGDYSQALDLFSQTWVDGPVSPATPEVRSRARAMMEVYTWGHWKNRAAESAAREAEQAARGDAEEPPTPEQPAAGPTMEEQLAAIRIPVLFLTGERDQPGVLASNEASVKLVPGAEVAVIPGAAHIIPLEQPDEFARVIIDFLERRGGPAHGG